MDANHGERRVERCEPLAASAADRHLMLLWQMANKQNYDASMERPHGNAYVSINADVDRTGCNIE